MRFLWQSMRSFKARIILIFFTFITIFIVLFIVFNQAQEKFNTLFYVASHLEEIKFDISNDALQIKALIEANNQDIPPSVIKNRLALFNSSLKNNKEQLNLLNSELRTNSFDFDSKFNTIISDINVIQQSTSKASLAIEIDDGLIGLNENVTSLSKQLKQLSQNKKKSFYDNALILVILIAVMMVVFVYFITYRMTNDFRKLSLKMANLNRVNQEPLSTNIQEVKDMSTSFEVLKAKIKKLESDLEESIKSCEYKSVFLANMSYEIRTPLNSVLGMINMLKQSDLTAEQQIQLEIAEYSSEHVLQLVSMILDNSKVGGGKVELELSAIDLRSDLSRLVKVFEYEAWDNSLDFEFKLLSDENQKFLLLGDLKRIKQILTNLLSNAFKFTNSGKVSLIIDQTVGPDDYQIVTFYVKDTGIGIPPEKAKRVLNDSEKNQVSILDYYGGTGLGLTASSQLIHMMGGELKLESKENEGSIFYFTIQLKKTLNLEKEKLEPSPVLLNKFDYKFKVLVAEDNKMNQKVIKFLLEEQGADCTFVKNGSDAVKLFNILDFDMIFMDIFMPEMDGYEATKLIKSSKKYLKNKIPIIAVSASAFDEDIKNAKEAGIDDFLAKPIESKKLKALLFKYAPKEENTNP